MKKREQLLNIASLLTSDDRVATKYADHLEELFDVIIPEKIGPEFCRAVRDNDYTNAVVHCAKYYRERASAPVPDLTAAGQYDLAEANNCVVGKARTVNIDWEFPEGEVDFLFNPTEICGPINHEWLWQFNRHAEWRNMACAYNDTGDEKYARAFSKQLLKWIAQTQVIEAYNGPGSAWRTIECGIRLLGNWHVAFDGFRKSPALADATVLLMIASMHRQTVHLINNPTGKNWLMMESNGAYTFSSLFGELSDSEANRSIAAERLLLELKSQILPDGMHNELSPDYQSVVLLCAANFYELARALGLEHEIPEDFIALIRDTVNAAILLSTPALTQPRTNDCFTIPTHYFTARAARTLGDSPEFMFINSARREGQPPRGQTPSAYLPYAGFVAMRSHWGADATYMCFDVGPLGMAHIHQDKLNINVFKGSQELIYDDGGGQYEISEARKYALSGYGHNTVLVDGLAQYRKVPLAATAPIDAGWVTNEAFDYAAATYDDTFGREMVRPATHKREVRFCKPDMFVVVDTLSSADGDAHDYEVLFHLDTTRVKPIPLYPNAVISDFGKQYEIAIIPLDQGEEVELKTVSAATEPRMQGWYNGRNEANLHAAITVSRKVSGVRNFKFVTLLLPTRADAPMPSVTHNPNGIVEVSLAGQQYKFNLNSLNK